MAAEVAASEASAAAAPEAEEPAEIFNSAF